MNCVSVWILVLLWLSGIFSANVSAAADHSSLVINWSGNSLSKIDSFKTALQNDGFKIQELTYGKVDLSYLVCKGYLKTAFGNNAGGSYLAINNANGVADEFQLEPNDAIVLVGRTPPPVAYFSYRSYLFKHQYDGDLIRKEVFARYDL